MNHVNGLAPNTCRCILRFEWTDEAPEVHSYTGFEHQCAAHAAFTAAQVHAENQLYTKAVAAASTVLPLNTPVGFRYDDQRNLQLLIDVAEEVKYGAQAHVQSLFPSVTVP